MRYLPLLPSLAARRRAVFWLGALGIFVVLGVLGVGSAQAQPLEPDPVVKLRDLVAYPPVDSTDQALDKYKKELEDQTKKLLTLGEKARGLILPEWRNERGADGKLRPQSARQIEVHNALAKAFGDEVKAVAQRGTSGQQIAVANLIVELALVNRIPEQSAQLAHDVAADQTDALITLSKSKAPLVQQAAARALCKIEGKWDATVPALKNLLLGDPNVETRREVARLINRTIDDRSPSRSGGQVIITDRAARLKEFISAANQVVPVLAEAVGDKDKEVRYYSLKALRGIAEAIYTNLKVGGEAKRPQWVVDLIEAMAVHMKRFNAAILDPDLGVRLAARGLVEDLAFTRERTQIGFKPVPLTDTLSKGLETLIPTLEKALKDSNVRGRLTALDALEGLERYAEKAAPAVVPLLRDPDRFVRWEAARVLGRINPQPVPGAIEGLVALLNESDTDIQRAAATTLGIYGPAAASAAEALAEHSRRGDVEVRIAAMQTLEQLGKEAAKVLPIVAANLDLKEPRYYVDRRGWPDATNRSEMVDSPAKVRQQAALTLGRFGNLARPTKAALEKALTDPDDMVRFYAAEALLNIKDN